MNIVCDAELHVTVIQKYLVLHNKTIMVNLCHRQQCKLYVPIFELNYIPTNLHSSHAAYERCIETKAFPFSHGLL